MICRGNGENKEYCDKVIKELLNNWDELVCKTHSKRHIKKNKCVIKNNEMQ